MEEDFAALKLFDSDTSNWNSEEIVSCTKTPSSHRICVKQIYESEAKSSLVTQFNYEQTFDKNAETRQIEVSKTVHIDNRTCNKDERRKSCFDQFKPLNYTKNVLYEPKFIPEKATNETHNIVATKSLPHCSMVSPDVANNKTDQFSYTESENSNKDNNAIKESSFTKNINEVAHTYQNMKIKLRALATKNKIPKRKKSNICYYSCLTLLVLPLITVIFSLLVNLNVYIVCDHVMLFSNATQELEQKIYGQEDAISHIVEYLNQDFFHLKVLCLIGGTGVGKSYTAQIITQHFPLQNEIFIYNTLVDDSIDTTRLNSLDSYQLIILENLKLKNLNRFSFIVDKVSERKDKCIMVIAIFNVEETNDNLEREVDLNKSINTIMDTLADKKINNLIVPYQPLNEKILEYCIEEAAMVSNLNLTSNQMNEIKESLMLSDSGCKGAYSKVQVFGRTVDAD